MKIKDSIFCQTDTKTPLEFEPMLAPVLYTYNIQNNNKSIIEICYIESAVFL